MRQVLGIPEDLFEKKLRTLFDSQDRALETDSYSSHAGIIRRRQGAVGEAIIHCLLTLAGIEPEIPEDGWFSESPDVSGYEVKTLTYHYKHGGYLVSKSQHDKIANSKGLFVIDVPLLGINFTRVLFTRDPKSVMKEYECDRNMCLDPDKFETHIEIRDAHVVSALRRYRTSSYEPY